MTSDLVQAAINKISFNSKAMQQRWQRTYLRVAYLYLYVLAGARLVTHPHMTHIDQTYMLIVCLRTPYPLHDSLLYRVLVSTVYNVT